MARIFGTSRSDLLEGTASDETLDGGSSSDTLNGYEGNDVLFGGSSSDLLMGGIGDDWLDGGSHHDTLIGGDGTDTLMGGAGNDVIYGEDETGGTITLPVPSVNLLINPSFEDVAGLPATPYGVHGMAINGWTLTAGTYFEMHETLKRDIAASDGFYWLDLGDTPGNISFEQAVSGLTAGDLYDLSFDAADTDFLLNNSVAVYWNGDLIDTVSPTSNVMQSHEYSVTAGSGDGSDTLSFVGLGPIDNYGVSLDNVSLSKAPVPVSSGNDVIDAGSGNDLVLAGVGDDAILGGSGNDTLIGGLGADTLTGGSGRDLFTYTDLSDSAEKSSDVIMDFRSTDVIDLTGLGFSDITEGAASGAVLGFVFDGTYTVISADSVDFSLMLVGEHDLDSGDFLF